ncbi:MAG: ribonuclease Z [Euryarchaeota archaeon]|nr:ribonuclease Z [Euryarchaeota archaeon]
MDIVFLGTSASWPSADRNVASIALHRGGEVILFDCGEGTQRQFQRSGLSYMDVSKIFITHLHGDHFLGLIGLIQTMYLNERQAPLHIYGPDGIRDNVMNLLSLGYFKPDYNIVIEELEDKDVVDFGSYSVAARAVKHNVHNLGYALVERPRPGRFNKERALELGVPEGPSFSKLQAGEQVETPAGKIIKPEQVLGPSRPGRKVAYSGDALPSESMVELAHGADVLIHDSTFHSDYKEANEYGHSTSAQAAFIAKKAQVRKLILTHFSARYKDVRPLVEDARKVFPGTEAAHDFYKVNVEFRDG